MYDLRVRGEPASEVEHPVESGADDQDHVRALHQGAPCRVEVHRVVVGDEAASHRGRQERHTEGVHQFGELLDRLGPADPLSDDHGRPLGIEQEVRGSGDLVLVALRR